MRVRLKAYFIKILMCSFLILLSGCAHLSKNYTVSTNIDRENFKEYFSASRVTVFKNEKEIPSPFKLLGLVEGEDCKVKTHHAAPTKIIAKQTTKTKAFNKGANGIIFTSCILLDNQKLEKQNGVQRADNQCLASFVCYGKAYKFQPLNTEKNSG